MTLRAGQAVPEFALVNQDGEIRRLADFRGQWLVLFFYSRAMTPG